MSLTKMGLFQCQFRLDGDLAGTRSATVSDVCPILPLFPVCGPPGCKQEIDQKPDCFRVDGDPTGIGERHSDIVDSEMIAADQSAELVIPIQLNKSDISESVKMRAIRTPFFWLFPPWVIVMVQFVLVSSMHIPQLNALGWALVAGLLAPIFLLYRSRAAILKQPVALAPMTFVFSAYGITADFENGTNKAAWSLVKGARETTNLFFIEMQRRSFHLIPKRQISEEQVSCLREILRANVSKNIRLLS